MASITKFLEERLKLKVNRRKVGRQTVEKEDTGFYFYKS